MGPVGNGSQVLKVIAIEKELENTKWESAAMYVEDLAEYARKRATVFDRLLNTIEN